MSEQFERESDEPLPSENGPNQYLFAIYRRRWIALTTFLVVMAYTGYQTFTTMPVYEATAQLLIKTDAGNVLTFEDVVKQDRASYDYAETQYRLLRSRALARRTLTALDMWKRPPFGDAAPAAAQSGHAVVQRSRCDSLSNHTDEPGAATGYANVRARRSERKQARVCGDRSASGRRQDLTHPEQPTRRREFSISRSAAGCSRRQ